MAEPIRVLHVIGYMDRGGAENMIMNLYRNIDRSRVQFDFVENAGPPTAFDEEILSLGGRIFRCPRYRGKNHFAYVRWWKKFFLEHKGEHRIVHGHIGSTAAIYLSIAGKNGLMTIAHSHNTGKGSFFYGVFSFFTRYVAHSFFACSKDAAVARFGEKVANNNQRCHVLNNAIDTERFAFDSERRAVLRQSLGLSADCFVVGHIGRFAEVKNHTFLIEIFDRIHRQKENSVLLLVGDGELRPKIESLVREKGLSGHAIFAGIKEDVWNYYQVMDVFVMPSLYEGLPVSMVEAQTAGLHCCVSTGVPKESAITGLVEFRSLDESAENWAEWILEKSECPHRDTSDIVRSAGYDITETAEWLQNFYLTERGK